jgi:WD40 repeat protein
MKGILKINNILLWILCCSIMGLGFVACTQKSSNMNAPPNTEGAGNIIGNAGTSGQTNPAGGTCGNGQKDGDETDVDCGGKSGCPKCIPFKTCNQDSDCLSEYATNAGSPPFTGITCTDSVDVKGQTITLQGKVCMSGELYGAAQNLANAWAQGGGQSNLAGGTCANGIKDSGETDVDCGGSCPPCAPFKTCNDNADCQTTATISGKAYTNIRCDNSVASFDPANPISLGKKQCVNESLVWDGIAAAVAIAQQGSGTGGGGGTNVASTCSNSTKDAGETDVDCGGGTCGACAPFKSCLQNSDCQSSITVNQKTYSIACLGPDGQKTCNSADLLNDIAAALPKRYTPSGCKDFQYTFVSDIAGADNVYAVPCDDDGVNHPAVKLTQNTDSKFHYDSIAIKPDATQVLYGTSKENMRWSLYLDSGPVIGQGNSELGLESAYGKILPTWESNGQEFGYVRFDINRKYEMALSNFSNLQNPWRLTSSGREIKGFVFSPTIADSNSPGYGKYIVSEKGTDGAFYLYIWKSGDSARSLEYGPHGDLFEWDKLPGTNPAISPDGTKLAYVNGNYIYYCPFDFTLPTGDTFYKCNGSLVGGASQVPVSSPCWSANGKFIYYQLNYLSINFIARYDVTAKTTVILDEFPQSPAYGGERNPGCYPLMN